MPDIFWGVLVQRGKTDRLDAKALHAYGKIVDSSELQVLKLNEKIKRLAALLSDYRFLKRQEVNFVNHLEALKRNPFSSSESRSFIRKQVATLRTDKAGDGRSGEEGEGVVESGGESGGDTGYRSNPEIREFYERLRRRGKAGKVAVVACMRKLALISWAYYKMAMHTWALGLFEKIL